VPWRVCCHQNPDLFIFGLHGGSACERGEKQVNGGIRIFSLSREWKELWDGQIFDQGKVKVEAFLKRTDRIEPNSTQTRELSVLASLVSDKGIRVSDDSLCCPDH